MYYNSGLYVILFPVIKFKAFGTGFAVPHCTCLYTVYIHIFMYMQCKVVRLDRVNTFHCYITVFRYFTEINGGREEVLKKNIKILLLITYRII